MSQSPPLSPAIFFGHGSPMEALGGRFADVWRDLGAKLARPKAVLMVSAHWNLRETAVTAMAAPRTIHDMYGFPDALYRIDYPAPGDPGLASRVAEMLAPLPVRLDQDWGLDHGVWAVLRHLFPEAETPVLELSIDETKPPEFHYAVGQKLRALREEGVLIAGSGNTIHNIRIARVSPEDAPPADWAVRFDDLVRESILNGDWTRLIDYPALGPDARLAAPTPDHYLPLLYVLGAAFEHEPAMMFNDVIERAGLSMFSVGFGLDAI